MVLENHADIATQIRHMFRADFGDVVAIDGDTTVVARSITVINFNSVLLPAPEWPVKNAISPCCR